MCDRLVNYGVKIQAKIVLCKREGVTEECLFGREVSRGAWIQFPWEV